ncbi:uncharacterized protein At2g29880-like [Aristolochia californica]|uniref:uncharacterized protein At2g29880-like n=1 Tax=Aristolochia californica TaxID=171875 RepID=UPI0035D6BC3E
MAPTTMLCFNFVYELFACDFIPTWTLFVLVEFGDWEIKITRRKGKDIMDNITKRSYDTWTSDEDCKMLDLLIEQVNMGNKLPNGVWKHEVFNDCVSMFNMDAMNQKTVEQLKNHVRTWKRTYMVVSTYLNTSDFGWDPTTQKVTASKTVWQDYIKMHREADKYRREGCSLYEKLAIVVGNTMVTGKASHISVELDDNLSSFVEGTMIDDIDEDDAIKEIPTPNIIESPSDAPPKSKAPSNDEDKTSSTWRRKRSEPLVENANRIVEAINNMSSTLRDIFTPPVEPPWFEALEALPNLPIEVKYYAMELLDTKAKKDMFLKMKPEDQYKWLMAKFNAMN